MAKKLKTERVPVMFDQALLDQLDEFSFENRIRTRGETIRRLVLVGMEAIETKKADAQA